MMKKIKVENIENIIKNWRRELHKIPELELELPLTVSYLENELKKLKIPYQKVLNNNALIAIVDSEKEGKTLGIRADMDALPIKENTGLDFAAINGNMHACGHDGHMAMVLGAAKILNENRDLFKGKVKIIFQPGEEYPGGAELLIKEKVLENPKVDAIIGMHEGYLDSRIKPGCIGYKKGALMASMDIFHIKIKGKGGHGAYPEKTVDSINIACEIINAINKITSREITSTSPCVLTVSQIHGGFNHNIIPEIVEFEGAVRTTDEKIRKYIKNRIEEITKSMANCYGASADIIYDLKYPVLSNDDEFTEFFSKVARNTLGEQRVVELHSPIMPSEDMAYFLKEIPGTFFLLSNPKNEINPKPNHNPEFDINEEYLTTGTELLVNTALEYLK